MSEPVNGAWMKEFLDGEEHVFPINDGIVHTITSDCICGPTEGWYINNAYPTFRHHALTKEVQSQCPL